MIGSPAKRWSFLLLALLVGWTGALGGDAAMVERFRGMNHAFTAAVGPGAAPRFAEPLPRRRWFIVILDGLRTQEATKPELMPAFDAVARAGLSGREKSCLSGMTVQCTANIFGGRDMASPLSFVGNFLPAESREEDNWIALMAAAGKHVDAVSDYGIANAYRPYLHDCVEYSHGHGYDDTLDVSLKAWPQTAEAIRMWKEQDSDVVVLHILDIDGTSHVYPTSAPEYVASVKETDLMVAAVASAVGEDGYLLITGDHGTTDDGMHAFGLDTPTHFALRGPGVPAGVRVDLDQASLRFFLSVFSGLPLPFPYHGETFWHLVPDGIAAGYGTPEQRALTGQAGRTGPAPWLLATLAVLVLAAGTALLGLVRADPPGRAGLAALLAGAVAWLALLGTGHLPWAAAALAAAGVAMTRPWRHPRFALKLVAASAVPVLLGAWYYELTRPIHDLGSIWTMPAWVAVAAIAAAVVARVRKVPFMEAWARTAAPWVAVAGLAWGIPSAYYYGIARAVPGLGLMLLAAILWGWRRTRPERAAARPLTWAAAAAFLVLALQNSSRVELFVLQRFFFFPTDGLPITLGMLVAVGALCAVLWTSRPPEGRAATYASAAAIAGTFAALLAGPSLNPFVFLGILGAAIAAALAGRERLLGVPAPLLVTCLLLAFLGYVSGFHAGRMTQLAGLALFAAVIARIRALDPDARPAWLVDLAVALLAILSMFVATGLRFSGIEFGFVFGWISPDDKERLWWLVGLSMLVRYVTPALLILLAARTAGRPGDGDLATSFLLGRGATIGVFLVSAAIFDPLQGVYANDAEGEVGLYMILATGILGASAIARRAARVRTPQLAVAPPAPGLMPAGPAA